MATITGKVERVSQKFFGGVFINGNWYNGTKDSEKYVKAAAKDRTYDLELNDGGYITSIRQVGGVNSSASPSTDDPIAKLVSGRQTALNCATNLGVALITAGKVVLKDGDSYVLTIMEIAKQLEQHLFRSPHEDEEEQ